MASWRFWSVRDESRGGAGGLAYPLHGDPRFVHTQPLTLCWHMHFNVVWGLVYTIEYITVCCLSFSVSKDLFDEEDGDQEQEGLIPLCN